MAGGRSPVLHTTLRPSVGIGGFPAPGGDLVPEGRADWGGVDLGREARPFEDAELRVHVAGGKLPGPGDERLLGERGERNLGPRRQGVALADGRHPRLAPDLTPLQALGKLRLPRQPQVERPVGHLRQEV